MTTTTESLSPPQYSPLTYTRSPISASRFRASSGDPMSPVISRIWHLRFACPMVPFRSSIMAFVPLCAFLVKPVLSEPQVFHSAGACCRPDLGGLAFDPGNVAFLYRDLFRGQARCRSRRRRRGRQSVGACSPGRPIRRCRCALCGRVRLSAKPAASARGRISIVAAVVTAWQSRRCSDAPACWAPGRFFLPSGGGPAA